MPLASASTATPSDSSFSSGNLKRRRIPLGLKLAYSAFMVVLVPVYWVNYGPTNFLYFCDIALFLTLGALWLENALLAGTAAVGIILPQFLWCADFGSHLLGFKITGMTDYMFDSERSLFLRGLSLFHGWLPFLLVFLVARLGYDRRSLFLWTAVAGAAILISFFFLPHPGAVLSNPKAPVNINYVFGMSDDAAQKWMPEKAWLILMLTALPVMIFTPTHFLLKKWFGKAKGPL